MNFRRYIPDHAVITIPALALAIVAHQYWFSDDPVDYGIEGSAAAPNFYQHWQWQRDDAEFDIDSRLQQLELEDAARDRMIRELLHAGHYQQARTGLLEVAAAAVLQEDRQRLGETLLLLGEVAINQQELAAAEIYLQEALYMSIERDDVLGAARSYQVLGQLNIRARELARQAANTHDELWQARNSIARGNYRGVAENLRRVIDENLRIRRYGAAADAWEALAALHDKLHDAYPAQLARIEAAKLFASIGQMNHVQRLVEGLDSNQISGDDLAQTRREIEVLFTQHQQDLVQTSQARDYQMLYHHYLRKGEVERAWQFRIKSSETLANSSERVLYQRQADVIAVLYNSNFAMDRARKFLDKAGSIFDDSDAREMLAQTRELKSLIY